MKAYPVAAMLRRNTASRGGMNNLRRTGMTVLLVLLAFISLNANAYNPDEWVNWLSAPMPAPAGEPGRWLTWDNQYNRVRSTFTNGGITEAQGEDWDAQQRAIVDFFKTGPVLAPPQPLGFFPQMWGSIGVLDFGDYVHSPKQAPLVGGVTFSAWPPKNVREGAGGELKAVGENALFRIEFNYVYMPGHMEWMADAEGEFTPVQKQGEFAGFPLINNSLVLTRDGRLPFVPVTRARALAALIAYNDKDLAASLAMGYTKERLSRQIEYLAGLQAQLKGMDKAQRDAPAWILFEGVLLPEIVDEGTAKAISLMAFDLEFFDPKQARQTMRIALVRELQTVAEQAKGGHAVSQIYLQLLQQTNWREFADRFLK